MNALKRTLGTFAIAATLMATPAPKANAGIVLAPLGIGVYYIILGIVLDDVFLLVLNDNNTQTQIQQILAERHSFIDDQQALNDLASAIASKIENAGEILQETEFKLTEDEILDILAPTGLIELEPLKVQALIHDLT